ncbi:Integrase core domain protein [compost metagenome]
MIPPELEAQILRLHHVEAWRPYTIAHQLGVHPSTVQRVLAQAGQMSAPTLKPSILDPYMPLMRKTLEDYPTLTAARLFHMLKARGYRGSEAHVRAIVQRIRPRKKAEAYLRLRTLPGEQAQVDWGHFGKLRVGDAERKLYAFVMVLSYSRAIFLRFYLGHDHTAFFLRGHQDAFAFFSGVPRTLLYDNLKSAVLERVGTAIRFNPRLLEFAAHHRFEPRPVNVARGNEKGRVERAIRYVRDSFFAARHFRDLDDLNAQALEWCVGPAMDRPCPEDRAISVRMALDDERPKLLALPDNPFDTDERVEVRVGKTPYVRFDLNDYSVPHDRVGRSLTVLAAPDTVRVLDAQHEVARHERTYDRARIVEHPAHIDALVDAKRRAGRGRTLNTLLAAVPSLKQVFTHLADEGMNLGNATQRLTRLLEAFGPQELERAVGAALERGRAHPGAIEQMIHQRRQARGMRPPSAAAVGELASRLVRPVRMAELSTYDRLAGNGGDEEVKA